MKMPIDTGKHSLGTRKVQKIQAKDFHQSSRKLSSLGESSSKPVGFYQCDISQCPLARHMAGDHPWLDKPGCY